MLRGKGGVQMPCLSRKQLEQTFSGNEMYFVGDNENKNSFIQFLVNRWRRNKLPINKGIYATNGLNAVNAFA